MNSVVSVSLDPLLLLFCAKLHSVTSSIVIETSIFSVNILTDQQRVASRYFSGLCDVPPIFEFGSAQEHVWIRDTVGSILCSVESTYRAGDHDIIVGRVHDIIENPDRPSPLIYHNGQYRTLGPVCVGAEHSHPAVISSLAADTV